jgi:hypothetical protein
MSFGIVELITVLMGIAGFGVGTNPKAPSPDQALEYGVADADIVAYFDAGSVIPQNYKVLTNLPNQPAIKASPELAKSVRKLIAEVDGPRGLVKGMTGIDLATDISDATAFFRIVPKRDPDFVVAVHGKFNVATIEKVAKAAGKPSVKAGSGAWFDAGDGNAVGITKGGVMLAGSTDLIKERMADTWKAPPLTAGTNLGNAAEVLGPKPVFAVVIALSATARADALANIQGQNFLTDLIKRHKMWSFAVHRDGIGWAWIDNSKTGLDAMAQISEGAIDLLRAAQIAPRGFAKITLGALESYKGTNKQVDELIKHKGDLWKIVDTYTGDGQFKAQVDKDPKTLKLSVRLTGKSLSEVVPLGGMLPFGVIGWLVLGRSEPMQSSAPPVIVAPPPPPPAPMKKQGNPPKRP